MRFLYSRVNGPIRVSACARAHPSVHVYTCVHMCAYAHAYTCVYTHSCTHRRTHMRTHVHIRSRPSSRMCVLARARSLCSLGCARASREGFPLRGKKSRPLHHGEDSRTRAPFGGPGPRIRERFFIPLRGINPREEYTRRVYIPRMTRARVIDRVCARVGVIPKGSHIACPR